MPLNPMSAPGLNTHSYPKKARLLKRSLFLKMAQRKGSNDLKIPANSFLIVGQNNDKGEHRLGVTVTKKTGHAVTRNRLKRQVREFFRHNRHNWPGTLDLIFIASPKAGKLTRAQVAFDLAKAGRKLNTWTAPAPRSGSDSTLGVALVVVTGSEAAVETASPEPEGFSSKPEGIFLSLWRSLSRIPSQLALGFIRFYRCFISPMLPPCCRFLPTCSGYGVEAITVHGFWKGSWLTARRILKCHPFYPGGYDPVPPAKPSLCHQGGLPGELRAKTKPPQSTPSLCHQGGLCGELRGETKNRPCGKR